MDYSGLGTTVRATVHRKGLLPALPLEQTAVVVLMVSGGSDSVALAHLLPQLYPQLNYTVLHINHQLRGTDADEDERFVVRLAEHLGLPCVTRRVDVAALAAQTGDNLEQAGRAVRYSEAQELLEALCKQHGCDLADGRIATAHTSDDRVETFFMRTIVGGGAGALSSIPYRNGAVVRPLLDCSREQLRGFLLASEQDSIISASTPMTLPNRPDVSDRRSLWREDETNQDTSRLRAFVRHELIPLAKTRNQQLVGTVARSLDTLACEDAFLNQLTNGLMERLVTLRDKTAYIDTALFDEDEALVRRVIKAAFDAVVAPGVRITSAHIVRITEQGNHVGFVTDAPGDMMVANEYGTLVIQRKTHPEVSWTSGALFGSGERVFALEEGCRQWIPGGGVVEFMRVAPESWGIDPVAFARSHASDSRVFVDGDALKRAGSTLYVRGIEAGDRFCPLGMQGHHRLVSDLLIDRKVLRRHRRGVGKVCVGGSRRSDGEGAGEPGLSREDDIVWIIGVCLDDRFKVTDATTALFCLTVTEDERTQHHA